MKRLTVLLLTVSALLALTACGGGGGGGDGTALPTGTWGESNWSQVRWGP